MIRYMRHSDLADVARLESELFTSASWSLAALERELDGPDRAYYVWVGAAPRRSQLDAPSPEGICGYAGIWYGGADAEVMTIGVAKDCQHAGIGRCLMRELIGAARRRCCRRVLLEVRVDNEPAKRLYHSLGFTDMGLRRHYYQPEDVDAVTMSLDMEGNQE